MNIIDYQKVTFGDKKYIFDTNHCICSHCKPVMSTCICILQANIERYAEKKRPFEVFSLVGRCTLDVILRCAFSYETDCQKEGYCNRGPYN